MAWSIPKPLQTTLKKENLENLEKIRKDLLRKSVSAVNLETGLYEPMEERGTYEDALSK